jgi:hypothetical protein
VPVWVEAGNPPSGAVFETVTPVRLVGVRLVRGPGEQTGRWVGAGEEEEEEEERGVRR